VRLRRLALVTLVAAAVVALPATSGFSAASADRSVEVAIVDDEDAYMTLIYDEDADVNADSGPAMYEYLTVKNKFTGSVDATVETTVVSDSGLTVTGPDELNSEPIKAGDEETLSVGLECDSSTGDTKTATISFDVTFEGNSVLAEANSGELRTVEVQVTCPDPTPTPTSTQSGS
jgi:hypothetical protein